MTPETQNIEWKRSWRDEYLAWICGFANAQGGVLEIGKNDRGEVVGVRNVLSLLEEIPNKVQSLLGIVVDVNLKSDNHGLEYIEIVVRPHTNPISYRGRFHYRSGSTKQVLEGPALTRLLLERHGRTWDDVPLPGVSLRSLKAGNPAPVWKLESGGTGLRLRFPFSGAWQAADREVRVVAVRPNTRTTNGKASPSETTQEPRVTTQKTTQINSRTTQKSAADRILDCIRAEPQLTRTLLAERVGLSPDGVKYHLKNLKAAGVLRRVGSDQAGHWEVIE